MYVFLITIVLFVANAIFYIIFTTSTEQPWNQDGNVEQTALLVNDVPLEGTNCTQKSAEMADVTSSDDNANATQ
jgi:hypothetical protein